MHKKCCETLCKNLNLDFYGQFHNSFLIPVSANLLKYGVLKNIFAHSLLIIPITRVSVPRKTLRVF